MRLLAAMLLACCLAHPAWAGECGCGKTSVHAAKSCTGDCCHLILHADLAVKCQQVCPPRHKPLAFYVPCDCHCPVTLHHKPVEPCLPTGAPEQHCVCHKPAITALLNLPADPAPPES